MQSKRTRGGAARPSGASVAAAPRSVKADETTTGGAPRLAPGLYLVATPIGNARDITLRALDVLRAADAIAAEDTRETRKLMEMHGIPLGGRPMQSYHDRNGPEARPRLQRWLEDGKAVAYCSDAGSPLIADPGYRLAEMAIESGHPVTSVPGPSAVIAALPLAGLPTDRFLFAGFLSQKAGERRRALSELAAVRATLVFYESPRRLLASLADMSGVLGATRPAAIARELTKLHEEVRRGALGDLVSALEGGWTPRGEVVVLVGPPGEDEAPDAADLDAALAEALGRLSVKDAAREVAGALGLPRREVYARALAISKGD